MENINRRELITGLTAVLATGNIEGVEDGKEFPSAEEITNTFRSLLQKFEATGAKILRKFEDEQGIIACDIEFTLADGETATLEYMRKGRHEVMNGSSSSRTNIYVTYFDSGMPCGGTNVAEYEDGRWRITADDVD